MHFPRACASASISPQRKISSGLTGPTKSLPAPTRSLTTTGHPQQLASLTTTANGSYSEGNTIKSAAVYTPGSCDWFTNPKNRTRSLIPSEAALLSSSPRKCPSPAYTNIASDRSIAEALRDGHRQAPRNHCMGQATSEKCCSEGGSHAEGVDETCTCTHSSEKTGRSSPGIAWGTLAREEPAKSLWLILARRGQHGCSHNLADREF